MPRLFEERERAAEMLFIRTEEARFIMHCQGVRSLAACAAKELGIDGQSAAAYARELLGASVQGTTDDDLVERVRADLEAGGVRVDPAMLRRELNRSTPQAVYEDAMTPAMSRASVLDRRDVV